ncbi:hypothetical protein ACHAXR_010473 [Thalassiosira sp. AJA248-18]
MQSLLMNKWRKYGAALLLGFCVLATYFSSFDGRLPVDNDYEPQSRQSRRFLRVKKKLRKLRDAMYPWAEHNLQPLTETPDPEKETVLFWHIPKSGGTTAKKMYSCLDVTIANRPGTWPKFGHDKDTELLTFRPWGKKGPPYVNVDPTSKEGILRAEKLGLVPSGMADIIFTTDVSYAIEHLYDSSHKGRVLGLFRHPVDRLVSKFYYLQIADWEMSYRPDWKYWSVEMFALKSGTEANHMVKLLAGKGLSSVVGEEDLQLAMRTVSERFVVGLTDHMEESIHRFNTVIGIDESTKGAKKCMDEFFGHGDLKKNSNDHPKLEEDSNAWKILAEKNNLDIRLYDLILQLFDTQKEIIESYTTSMATQDDHSR